MPEDNKLINVDRNIVENINDFSVFGKDESLVKTLLYYFAYQHRYYPEEFGVLDPEKFARECGYDAATLRHKHDQPAQLIGLNQQQLRKIYAEADKDPSKKVLDNTLENALYKLLTQNMIYRNKSKIYSLQDGRMVAETSFQSFSFLKQLSVSQVRTPAGRIKILYQYEVTESFINHMGLYYVPCDLSKLVYFRKKRKDNLYLFLIRAHEYCMYKNLERFETHLDTLCQWANFVLKEDREKKRKVTEVFKEFASKTDFAFELVWEKRENERWAYRPVLVFPNVQSGDKRDITSEKVGLFYNNLVNELSVLYKQTHQTAIYGKDYVAELLSFIQNVDCIEEKIEAYYTAEKRTYVTPKGAPRRAQEFFQIAQTSDWKTFEDMKKAIWSYHQKRNRLFF